MTFCKQVCPWVIKQSKQASTWRGVAIGVGAVAMAVNPILGTPLALLMAKIVAVIDIVKDDSKTSK